MLYIRKQRIKKSSLIICSNLSKSIHSREEKQSERSERRKTDASSQWKQKRQQRFIRES